MRVLLINSSSIDSIGNRYLYLPSSLLYLSASLKRANIEAEILDCNVQADSCIMDRISNWLPDMVGISCLFSAQVQSMLNAAISIKKVHNIPIVIGGIHPTIYYKEILENCPDIDYVVFGEGEETLVSLCRSIQKKQNIQEVDGIAYRDQNSIIVQGKKKYSKVDDLAWPDYKAVHIPDYFRDTSQWHNPRKLPINTSIPIISSRSCPMNCNFCSLFLVMGTKFRGRDPIDVVDEMEYLYKKYDHHHFSFFDDNFTLNRSRILTICSEIIRRKMNIQFETPNGVFVNSLDKTVLDAMVSAGLVRISLAIESGSEYIRNSIMGKHLPTDKIYEIASLCKEYPQLYTRAFFILGMPEDTCDTVQETYNMIIRINVDQPIVTNLMPFPGTKLFEQCLRDNLLVGINVKDLWKYANIYFTGNKQFFVKPYNMLLEDLVSFRIKFDDLCNITRKGK